MDVPLSLVLAGAVCVIGYVALPILAGAPWWPAPTRHVMELLREAGLKEGEMLVDLGCGHGEVLIEAARTFGCRGRGVDIDPLKTFVARLMVRRAGLAGRIDIVRAHARNASLGDADVVFMYLSHQLIDRLTPKLVRELKPGARIVSYGFMVKGFPLAKTDKARKSFIYRMDLGKNINQFT